MKLAVSTLIGCVLSANVAIAESTITANVGCPTSVPGNVMVTRSSISVPVCAGNGTQPSAIPTMTMSGSNPSGTTVSPTQFTGGAAQLAGRGIGPVAALFMLLYV